MTEPFDAYHRWLGIPPKDQPPNHYRLLGLELFEGHPDVIELAADRQMAHVRTFQTGRHAELSQRILNELSQARLCLLKPERKAAYDAALRAQQAGSPSSVVAAPPLAADAPPPRVVVVPARSESAAPAVTGIPPRRSRRQAPVGVLVALGLGGVAVIAVTVYLLLAHGTSTDLAAAPGSPIDGGPSSGTAVRSTTDAAASARPNGGRNKGVPSLPNRGGSPVSRPATPSGKSVSRGPSRDKGSSQVGGATSSENTSSPPPTSSAAGDAIPGEWPAATSQAIEQMTDPERAVVARVTKAQGVFTSRYAFCLAMPLKDVSDVCDALRAAGYRPSQIRPYAVEGDVLASALWQRDGRPWHVAVGMDAGAVRKATENLLPQGYVPVDVAAYRDGGTRYVAVWGRPSVKMPAYELQLGITSQVRDESYLQLRAEGAFPLAIQFYYEPGSKRLLNRIWLRPPERRQFTLWNGDAAFVSIRQLLPGRVPLDLRLFVNEDTSPPSHGYTGVTLMQQAKRASAVLLDLTPDEHTARAEELAAQGYFPVAVAAVSMRGSGPTVAASIWHWPPGQPRPGPDQIVTVRGTQPPPALATTHTPVPAAAPLPSGKGTPPTGEALVRAEARLRETAGPQIDGATTPHLQRELAEELLNRARSEPDAALRFATLMQCRQLAQHAVDVELARNVVNELDRTFDVDVLTLTTEDMEQLLLAAGSSGSLSYVLSLAVEQVEELAQARRFDAALELLDVVATESRQARAADVARFAKNRMRELETSRDRWDKVREAEEQLISEPDNASAKLLLGRYQCFVRGDWNQGLPLLSASSDNTLSRIAQFDLSKPQDAEAQVKLGDQWQSWATTADPVDRSNAWLRAQFWFATAYPRLEPQQQRQLDRKLLDLDDKIQPRTDTQLHLSWLDVGPVEVRRLDGHKGAIESLAVSGSGRVLVSGSRDKIVRVWDLAGGRPVGGELKSESAVRSVAWSAKLDAVLAAGDFPGINGWNRATGNPLTLLPDKRRVPDFCLAEDGKHVLAAFPTENTNNVLLCDLGARRVTRKLDCPGQVLHVALAPGMKLVAVADGNHQVQVWDLSNGVLRQQLAGHNSNCTDVAFAPNGRWLASCDRRDIRIWDAERGTQLQLIGDLPFPDCAMFSADGHQLIAGGSDSVAAYDVRTGRRISAMRIGSDASRVQVTALALLPDPRAVVVGDAQGTIHVLRLP